MTNERLQELLNIILFSDEITTETDNAHIEIVEEFEENQNVINKLMSDCRNLEKEKMVLLNQINYWKTSFNKQVKAGRDV